MTTDPIEVNSPEFYTLGDLVHRLRARAGERDSTTVNAAFMRAIQDTLRRLPAKHDWSYYQRRVRFQTTAAVEMEISYDYTGGDYERLVTITDEENEFPSDAVYGEVVIEDIPYRVDRRISATQVILRADECPTEDYDAGEEATWQRTSYPLPRRVTRIHYLICHDQGVMPLYYQAPQDFYSTESMGWGTTGGPTRYTLRNIGRVGETGIVLSPAPSEAHTYEASVTVSPAIPSVIQVTGTDAAITAGTNVMTSATAAFTDRLLGALLRISIDDAYPVGDAFSHSWQAFVTSVDSATQITLSEYATDAVAAGTYCISSPIDIDTDSMLNYVEAEAFAQYCRNHNHESLAKSLSISAADLREAIIADQRVNKIRAFEPYFPAPGYGYWCDRYIYDC